MLGWRKRNDGFEWREYVRTTILVRRRNRRERLGEAGKVAVGGLKAAGERGAHAGAKGAQALGRGAKAAGQQGMMFGAAGVRAADSKLRAGLPKLGAAVNVGSARAGGALKASGARAGAGLMALGGRTGAALKVLGAYAGAALIALWAGLRAMVVWLGRTARPVFAAARRGLEPAFSALRQPNIALPLVVVGGVALLAAAARGATGGFDRDTFIALLIGLVVLCALGAARYADGAPAWLARPLQMAGGQLGRLGGGLRTLGPSGASVLRGAAIAAGLAFVAVAGWYAWRAVPPLSLLTRTAPDRSAIEGRAVAVSGDTLRVGKTTVGLSGIEAPLNGQTCLSDTSRPWRCDASAKTALARLVRGERVTCALSGSADDDRRIGTCRIGEKDIAAELVRGGHVFAETGLFSSYGSLESQARSAKAGLWSGEAERPADYRAQKWADAKRDAPDGCPIKGNVTGGRRLYVLPWTQEYARVRVTRARGERWFCSEADAQAAGWKPSDRS